jgi:hypothetical protein
MLWLILAYLFGVASGAVGMMFVIAWAVEEPGSRELEAARRATMEKGSSEP